MSSAAQSNPYLLAFFFASLPNIICSPAGSNTFGFFRFPGHVLVFHHVQFWGKGTARINGRSNNGWLLPLRWLWSMDPWGPELLGTRAARRGYWVRYHCLAFKRIMLYDDEMNRWWMEEVIRMSRSANVAITKCLLLWEKTFCKHYSLGLKFSVLCSQ